MKKKFYKTVLLGLALATAGIYSCKKKDDDSPAPAIAENTINFDGTSIVWDSSAASTSTNYSTATSKEFYWKINSNHLVIYTSNYDTIKTGTYNLGNDASRISAESTPTMFVEFYSNTDYWGYETTDSSTGSVTVSQVGDDKFVTFNDVELFAAWNNNARTSAELPGIQIGDVKILKGKMAVKHKPYVYVPPVDEIPIDEVKPIIVK
jgi:hypothetical protein